jgi:hypothetical protein
VLKAIFKKDLQRKVNKFKIISTLDKESEERESESQAQGDPKEDAGSLGQPPPGLDFINISLSLPSSSHSPPSFSLFFPSLPLALLHSFFLQHCTHRSVRCSTLGDQSSIRFGSHRLSVYSSPCLSPNPALPSEILQTTIQRTRQPPVRLQALISSTITTMTRNIHFRKQTPRRK